LNVVRNAFTLRDVASDGTLARELADGAGAVLLRLRAQSAADGTVAEVLRERGDRASHEYLATRLAELRPADTVRSEEDRSTDGARRRSADRVWIIDPLDGTREFAEPGRCDWAVHVALWQSGELVAGAVALPALDTTIATDAPPRPPEKRAGRIRLVVSRTRPPAQARRVAAALDAELLGMGSAGAKAMAVLRGDADVYLHDGGQYEWDSAAPVAVARAAGLHASRLDGGPLEYNRPDPLLPDLLICRSELAAVVLGALAGSA
jgi:3'(2'), 5'-bisphosphate nucleotidase